MLKKLLTSMLEFLDERGLATVTRGKKSLSWLYSRLTSLPLQQNKKLQCWYV